MKRNLVLLVFVGVALLVGVNAHAWDTNMHVQIASVVEDYAVCPSGSYDFHQYVFENYAAHPDSPYHTQDYWGNTWYLPYGREYNHHTCVGIGDMAHVWVSDYGTSCFGDRGCADTNADLWWKEAYYNKYFYEMSTSSFYSTYCLLGEGSHYAQDVCYPWHTTALSAYQICHTSSETFAWNNFYSGYMLSNSVREGAVWARYYYAPSHYDYDKFNMVHEASNLAYTWSFGSGLNCANYGSWDKKQIWQNLTWLAGAATMVYMRPICQ